uniref:Uncharacterized protein n=1 Tax=Rousettus aegyptiacus TaxID=9407 RepID=A0A7J8KAV7_ROUAE|nr:hypothetical protein HJG63_007835 [Rousettus aegyptiacus]
MSSLVHLPCRKKPTRGPTRQWYQWAPCRVGVPLLACTMLQGHREGQGLMPGPSSSWHDLAFLGGTMGYSYTPAPSCPTGKPWSHPLSQQDSLWLEQRELQSSEGDAWPSQWEWPLPQLLLIHRTVPQAWTDQLGSQVLGFCL